MSTEIHDQRNILIRNLSRSQLLLLTFEGIVLNEASYLFWARGGSIFHQECSQSFILKGFSSNIVGFKTRIDCLQWMILLVVSRFCSGFSTCCDTYFYYLLNSHSFFSSQVCTPMPMPTRHAFIVWSMIIAFLNDLRACSINFHPFWANVCNIFINPLTMSLIRNENLADFIYA